jgi:leucyl/phenylalanyl-tRNA--protein transferase
LNAYHNGIFPWFGDDEPFLWWSPDPRGVLFPNKLHIGRSLRRHINKKPYQASINRAFIEVMQQCASPRKDTSDTWITESMMEAYFQMHKLGYAHSFEIWQNDSLVGGLYGIQTAQVFCAESMFHTANNASKFAIINLVDYCLQNNIQLIDIQMISPHLLQMGAEEISRDEYLQLIKTFV